MKYSLLILLVSLFLFGCEKEQNKDLLGAYFKFTIDGVETVIENGSGIYSNTFSCEMFGDTAIYINVSKQYKGAGFFIKASSIANGTYQLNHINKAYYTNPLDYKRYATNETHTGQVSIQKGTFQAKTVLNTLQGTFSYTAVDTITHNTFNLTNGSFLMEITER